MIAQSKIHGTDLKSGSSTFYAHCSEQDMILPVLMLYNLHLRNQMMAQSCKYEAFLPT